VYARAYRKLYATDGTGKTNGWTVVIIHNDIYSSKKRKRNTTNDLDTQRNAHSPGVTTLRSFVSIVTRLRVGRAGVRVPKG
jgi:DNA-directed RNA polymerase specialized sigma24 family protein